MARKLILTGFLLCGLLCVRVADARVCPLGYKYEDGHCILADPDAAEGKCSGEYKICDDPRAGAHYCLQKNDGGQGIALYKEKDCCSTLGYNECEESENEVGYGGSCLGSKSNKTYWEFCGCSFGFVDTTPDAGGSVINSKDEIIKDEDGRKIPYLSRCGYEDTGGKCQLAICNADRRWFSTKEKKHFGNDYCLYRLPTKCGAFGCKQLYDCNNEKDYYRSEDLKFAIASGKTIGNGTAENFIEYREDDLWSNEKDQAKYSYVTGFGGDREYREYKPSGTDLPYGKRVSEDVEDNILYGEYELTNRIVCGYLNHSGVGPGEPDSAAAQSGGLDCNNVKNYCFKWTGCNTTRGWYDDDLNIGVLYGQEGITTEDYIHPEAYEYWMNEVERDLTYNSLRHYRLEALAVSPAKAIGEGFDLHPQNNLLRENFFKAVNNSFAGKYNETTGETLSNCGVGGSSCEIKNSGKGCTYITHACHRNARNCYKRIGCSEENRFYHSFINAAVKAHDNAGNSMVLDTIPNNPDINVLYNSSLNGIYWLDFYKAESPDGESGLNPREIYPACIYQINACNDTADGGVYGGGCYKKVGCIDNFEDIRSHITIESDWMNWFKDWRPVCNDSTRCYQASACDLEGGSYSSVPNTSFFNTIHSTATMSTCYRGANCNFDAGAYSSVPNALFFYTIESMATGSSCYRGQDCNYAEGAYSSVPNTSFFNISDSIATGSICYRGEGCREDAGAYVSEPNALFFKTIASEATATTCYRGEECGYAEGAYTSMPNTSFFVTIDSYASGSICYRAEGCLGKAGAYESEPNTSFFTTITSEATMTTCYRGDDCNYAEGAYSSAPNNEFFTTIESHASGSTCYRAQCCTPPNCELEKPDTSFFYAIYSEASDFHGELACYRAPGCHQEAGAYVDTPNVSFFETVSNRFGEACRDARGICPGFDPANTSICYRGTACNLSDGAYISEPNTSFFKVIDSLASGSQCYRGEECAFALGAYSSTPNTSFFYNPLKSIASGSECYRKNDREGAGKACNTDAGSYPIEEGEITLNTSYFFTIESMASGTSCYRASRCHFEAGAYDDSPNTSFFYLVDSLKSWHSVCYRAHGCHQAAGSRAGVPCTESDDVSECFTAEEADLCMSDSGCVKTPDINPKFFRIVLSAASGSLCYRGDDCGIDAGAYSATPNTSFFITINSVSPVPVKTVCYRGQECNLNAGTYTSAPNMDFFSNITSFASGSTCYRIKDCAYPDKANDGPCAVYPDTAYFYVEYSEPIAGYVCAKPTGCKAHDFDISMSGSRVFDWAWDQQGSKSCPYIVKPSMGQGYNDVNYCIFDRATVPGPYDVLGNIGEYNGQWKFTKGRLTATDTKRQPSCAQNYENSDNISHDECGGEVAESGGDITAYVPLGCNKNNGWDGDDYLGGDASAAEKLNSCYFDATSYTIHAFVPKATAMIKELDEIKYKTTAISGGTIVLQGDTEDTFVAAGRGFTDFDDMGDSEHIISRRDFPEWDASQQMNKVFDFTTFKVEERNLTCYKYTETKWHMRREYFDQCAFNFEEILSTEHPHGLPSAIGGTGINMEPCYANRGAAKANVRGIPCSGNNPLTAYKPVSCNNENGWYSGTIDSNTDEGIVDGKINTKYFSTTPSIIEQNTFHGNVCHEKLNCYHPVRPRCEASPDIFNVVEIRAQGGTYSCDRGDLVTRYAVGCNTENGYYPKVREDVADEDENNMVLDGDTLNGKFFNYRSTTISTGDNCGKSEITCYYVTGCKDDANSYWCNTKEVEISGTQCTIDDGCKEPADSQYFKVETRTCNSGDPKTCTKVATEPKCKIPNLEETKWTDIWTWDSVSIDDTYQKSKEYIESAVYPAGCNNSNHYYSTADIENCGTDYFNFGDGVTTTGCGHTVTCKLYNGCKQGEPNTCIVTTKNETCMSEQPGCTVADKCKLEPNSSYFTLGKVEVRGVGECTIATGLREECQETDNDIFSWGGVIGDGSSYIFCGSDYATNGLYMARSPYGCNTNNSYFVEETVRNLNYDGEFYAFGDSLTKPGCANQESVSCQHFDGCVYKDNPDDVCFLRRDDNSYIYERAKSKTTWCKYDCKPFEGTGAEKYFNSAEYTHKGRTCRAATTPKCNEDMMKANSSVFTWASTSLSCPSDNSLSDSIAMLGTGSMTSYYITGCKQGNMCPQVNGDCSMYDDPQDKRDYDQYTYKNGMHCCCYLASNYPEKCTCCSGPDTSVFNYVTISTSEESGLSDLAQCNADDISCDVAQSCKEENGWYRTCPAGTKSVYSKTSGDMVCYQCAPSVEIKNVRIYVEQGQTVDEEENKTKLQIIGVRYQVVVEKDDGTEMEMLPKSISVYDDDDNQQERFKVKIEPTKPTGTGITYNTYTASSKYCTASSSWCGRPNFVYRECENKEGSTCPFMTDCKAWLNETHSMTIKVDYGDNELIKNFGANVELECVVKERELQTCEYYKFYNESEQPDGWTCNNMAINASDGPCYSCTPQCPDGWDDGDVYGKPDSEFFSFSSKTLTSRDGTQKKCYKVTSCNASGSVGEEKPDDEYIKYISTSYPDSSGKTCYKALGCQGSLLDNYSWTSCNGILSYHSGYYNLACAVCNTCSSLGKGTNVKPSTEEYFLFDIKEEEVVEEGYFRNHPTMTCYKATDCNTSHGAAKTKTECQHRMNGISCGIKTPTKLQISKGGQSASWSGGLDTSYFDVVSMTGYRVSDNRAEDDPINLKTYVPAFAGFSGYSLTDYYMASSQTLKTWNRNRISSYPEDGTVILFDKYGNEIWGSRNEVNKRTQYYTQFKVHDFSNNFICNVSKTICLNNCNTCVARCEEFGYATQCADGQIGTEIKVKPCDDNTELKCYTNCYTPPDVPTGVKVKYKFEKSNFICDTNAYAYQLTESDAFYTKLNGATLALSDVSIEAAWGQCSINYDANGNKQCLNGSNTITDNIQICDDIYINMEDAGVYADLDLSNAVYNTNGPDNTGNAAKSRCYKSSAALHNAMAKFKIGEHGDTGTAEFESYPFVRLKNMVYQGETYNLGSRDKPTQTVMTISVEDEIIDHDYQNGDQCQFTKLDAKGASNGNSGTYTTGEEEIITGQFIFDKPSDLGKNESLEDYFNYDYKEPCYANLSCRTDTLLNKLNIVKTNSPVSDSRAIAEIVRKWYKTSKKTVLGVSCEYITGAQDDCITDGEYNELYYTDRERWATYTNFDTFETAWTDIETHTLIKNGTIPSIMRDIRKYGYHCPYDPCQEVGYLKQDYLPAECPKDGKNELLAGYGYYTEPETKRGYQCYKPVTCNDLGAEKGETWIENQNGCSGDQRSVQVLANGEGGTRCLACYKCEDIESMPTKIQLSGIVQKTNFVCAENKLKFEIDGPNVQYTNIAENAFYNFSQASFSQAYGENYAKEGSSEKKVIPGNSESMRLSLEMKEDIAEDSSYKRVGEYILYPTEANKSFNPNSTEGCFDLNAGQTNFDTLKFSIDGGRLWGYYDINTFKNFCHRGQCYDITKVQNLNNPSLYDITGQGGEINLNGMKYQDRDISEWNTCYFKSAQAKEMKDGALVTRDPNANPPENVDVEGKFFYSATNPEYADMKDYFNYRYLTPCYDCNSLTCREADPFTDIENIINNFNYSSNDAKEADKKNLDIVKSWFTRSEMTIEGCNQKTCAKHVCAAGCLNTFDLEDKCGGDLDCLNGYYAKTDFLNFEWPDTEGSAFEGVDMDDTYFKNMPDCNCPIRETEPCASKSKEGEIKYFNATQAEDEKKKSTGAQCFATNETGSDGPCYTCCGKGYFYYENIKEDANTYYGYVPEKGDTEVYFYTGAGKVGKSDYSHCYMPSCQSVYFANPINDDSPLMVGKIGFKSSAGNRGTTISRAAEINKPDPEQENNGLITSKDKYWKELYNQDQNSLQKLKEIDFPICYTPKWPTHVVMEYTTYPSGNNETCINPHSLKLYRGTTDVTDRFALSAYGNGNYDTCSGSVLFGVDTVATHDGGSEYSYVQQETSTDVSLVAVEDKDKICKARVAYKATSYRNPYIYFDDTYYSGSTNSSWLDEIAVTGMCLNNEIIKNKWWNVDRTMRAYADYYTFYDMKNEWDSKQFSKSNLGFGLMGDENEDNEAETHQACAGTDDSGYIDIYTRRDTNSSDGSYWYKLEKIIYPNNAAKSNFNFTVTIQLPWNINSQCSGTPQQYSLDGYYCRAVTLEIKNGQAANWIATYEKDNTYKTITLAAADERIDFSFPAERASDFGIREQASSSGYGIRRFILPNSAGQGAIEYKVMQEPDDLRNASSQYYCGEACPAGYKRSRNVDFFTYNQDPSGSDCYQITGCVRNAITEDPFAILKAYADDNTINNIKKAYNINSSTDNYTGLTCTILRCADGALNTNEAMEEYQRNHPDYKTEGYKWFDDEYDDWLGAIYDTYGGDAEDDILNSFKGESNICIFRKNANNEQPQECSDYDSSYVDACPSGEIGTAVKIGGKICYKDCLGIQTIKVYLHNEVDDRTADKKVASMEADRYEIIMSDGSQRDASSVTITPAPFKIRTKYKLPGETKVFDLENCKATGTCTGSQTYCTWDLLTAPEGSANQCPIVSECEAWIREDPVTISITNKNGTIAKTFYTTNSLLCDVDNTLLPNETGEELCPVGYYTEDEKTVKENEGYICKKSVSASTPTTNCYTCTGLTPINEELTMSFVATQEQPEPVILSGGDYHISSRLTYTLKLNNKAIPPTNVTIVNKTNGGSTFNIGFSPSYSHGTVVFMDAVCTSNYNRGNENCGYPTANDSIILGNLRAEEYASNPHKYDLRSCRVRLDSDVEVTLRNGGTYTFSRGTLLPCSTSGTGGSSTLRAKLKITVKNKQKTTGLGYTLTSPTFSITNASGNTLSYNNVIPATISGTLKVTKTGGTSTVSFSATCPTSGSSCQYTDGTASMTVKGSACSFILDSSLTVKTDSGDYWISNSDVSCSITDFGPKIIDPIDNGDLPSRDPIDDDDPIDDGTNGDRVVREGLAPE